LKNVFFAGGGVLMKKSIAAALLCSALPVSAHAAPLPTFTWTGFYVGVNEGYSFGNSTKTNSFNDGEGFSGPVSWDHAGLSGFSGGGQFGYHYEFENNVVLGFEADFQGSTLNGGYPTISRSYTYDDGEGGGYGAGSSSRGSQTSVNWWGTLRGRFGYAFGNFLPYVTGGFAYGRIENTRTYSAQGYGYFDDGEGYYSYNRNRTSSYGGVVPGWTVGTGFEYALTQNVIFKLEYLYTDLANLNHVSSYDSDYSSSTKVTFSTVRAGLSWKFN
jgi:outer membrane immunogenic protein